MTNFIDLVCEMTKVVCEMTNLTDQQASERAPLLPDRHPEPDFFICDIFDSAPKSDTASM